MKISALSSFQELQYSSERVTNTHNIAEMMQDNKTNIKKKTRNVKMYTQNKLNNLVKNLTYVNIQNVNTPNRNIRDKQHMLRDWLLSYWFNSRFQMFEANPLLSDTPLSILMSNDDVEY